MVYHRKKTPSAPGHLNESAGQVVGEPTDFIICNSGGEAITRSGEVTREDTESISCMDESRSRCWKAIQFSPCMKTSEDTVLSK